MGTEKIARTDDTPNDEPWNRNQPAEKGSSLVITGNIPGWRHLRSSIQHQLSSHWGARLNVSNQAEHKNDVYFTVIPSKAGFTDQLFQFSTFYKLGRSLGYTYLHSGFTNSRPGAEDIYEFLGFNEHFATKRLTDRERAYRFMGMNNCLGNKEIRLHNRIKNKIKYWVFHALMFNKFNFIDVGLGQSVPIEADADPIKGLKSLVRGLVAKKYRTDSGCKNVVRFYLTSGRSFFSQLAPLINQQMPLFPDKLDLRATYFSLRKTSPIKSRYSGNKTNLVVHIRLGDTALIETPWHTFVPLWSDLCISPLKEYPDKQDELFLQVMDEGDFYGFLRKFTSFFNADDLSIAIFSDGYKTAFKELFRQIGDLHLDSHKLDSLKDAVVTHEEKRFSIFDDMKNCTRVVGETNGDLQELVHSSLTADIIVVGCHQRMIPKFLATYYDASLKNPPIIISLYRGRVPRYQLKIGLDERKAKLYPVDINTLECDDALTDLVQEIKQRHSVA